MEILFTLRDYSIFKNALDEYYNDLMNEDRKEKFKDLIIRIQQNTNEEHQEPEGQLMTFKRVIIDIADFEKVKGALITYKFTADLDEQDSKIVDEIVDRLNKIKIQSETMVC